MTQPNPAARTCSPKRYDCHGACQDNAPNHAVAQALQVMGALLWTGVRQKAIFYVPHCDKVQPASWCHRVEDATYSSFGELEVTLQVTLFIYRIRKLLRLNQRITTRFPEIPCSALLSSVQLKITCSGMNIWVEEGSRAIFQVSGTSCCREGSRQSTLSSCQLQPNDNHRHARLIHGAMWGTKLSH